MIGSNMERRTTYVSAVFSRFISIFERLAADLSLKNSLAANPGKSMYGFTLNRKRPGHFSLCFLANKNSVVQTWVRTGTSTSLFLLIQY